MHNQSPLSQDKTIRTASLSPNKTSLARTDYTVSPGMPQDSFNSQQTLADTLPFNSRAFDFEEHGTFAQLEQELQDLQKRFQGIHKIFINHSEFQSDLHESKRGYKVLPIDHDALIYEFTNKAQIIAQITELVDRPQQHQNIEELLESKFQEYYLQRHYGSLECNFGNLSIQERSEMGEPQEQGEGYLQSESRLKSVVKQQCLKSIVQVEKAAEQPLKSTNSSLSPLQSHSNPTILSKLDHYESLTPYSKITYSQQFCQTQQIDYDIYVQIPRVIEVEVPVIVYKEMVIRYEESDMMGDIGMIIDKFSMKYEEIYSQAEENGEEKDKDQIVFGDAYNGKNKNLQTVAPSGMASMAATQTQIELAYSDFPDEDQLKLPLDSYAQLQSLISNSSRPDTDRSQHELPLPNDTVFITEKVISRSIIQKYQESQRTLIFQNSQLKQYISTLQNQLKEYQKQKMQLEKQNNRLALRLQEEIQQSQYFSNKLEELDVELLEEKVQALEHIGTSRDRKIEMLSNEIKSQMEELELSYKQLEQLQKNLRQNEMLIAKKDEEIASLTKMLEDREEQLASVAFSEDDMIQLASETEINLKDQIQKLQKQKCQLKDNLKFYQQRLINQGISLQMDEATDIQGYIEQRQHNFNLELQEVNKKYDQVLNSYQTELQELKGQLIKLKDTNQNKNKQIRQKDEKAKKQREEQEKHCLEFEEIVNEYHEELEKKDNEIIALKKNIADVKVDVGGDIEAAIVIERAYRTIRVLQSQLVLQRQHKSALTTQLVQLDTLVHNFISSPPSEADADLISELSTSLQQKITETDHLRNLLSEKQHQLSLITQDSVSEFSHEVQQENSILKKSNSKLKRYAESLEQQIKALCACGFDKVMRVEKDQDVCMDRLYIK